MTTVPPFDDVPGAHEWMHQQIGGWAGRLDDERTRALRAYKSTAYFHLNEALRTGQATRFDAPQWRAITEAIGAEALTEPVTVFRSIDDYEIAELVLLDGAEIPHEGFTSVSVVRAVAESFLHECGDSDVFEEDNGAARNVLLIAELPAGTHAVPLDG
ncbi:MAG: ADP-ribosyltransferase [Patulibacter sp.]